MNLADIKEYITYNPSSGVFTRIARQGRMSAGSPVGTYDKDGYHIIYYNNTSYKAHRLAWWFVHNVLPKGQIDHINHVVDDNRICNLREVSHQENSRNQVKRSTNTSGVTGVYWNKARKRWVANIWVDDKCKYLGGFETIEEAKQARLKAQKGYKYHINHGGN
jgi:hypothetical protein